MAVFRIEKTRDYTVMSNHHLKDRTLTLKSKGLLSMMLSLPDEWNYTTRGLAAICREGVDSIGAALKELESHGYIRRTQLRDEKGKITDTEYVIYEMPQCEPSSSPGTPLPGTAKPYTENPDMGIPDTAEPCTENPAQLNQVPQPDKLPKIHEIQSAGLYPIRERYLKAGERPDYEHEGRRRKIFGRFLGQSRTPLLFRTDRLHLVRGHGGRKELHHASGPYQCQ